MKSVTLKPQTVASGFHILVKPRGAICNLDCKYCFFLPKEKLYPGSSFRMSDEVLEAYTRQHIQAQNTPEVMFAWQGGEPTLMGLDFFRRAVDFQKQYQKPDTQIVNTFQTNGTTLDDEWCEFFLEHNFLLGISLDGPPEMHDKYRVTKGGHPTFSRVMAGIDLVKQYGVEFNILTTVNAANAEHGLQVYQFLRDNVGTQFIQFIPIVERDNDTGFQEGDQITNRSVTGEQYGRFLIEVFDEWLRHDVGQVFVQLFDVSLAAWLKLPPTLCVFAEKCGGALALEHNGDLYSCDHYVEPRYHLGNVMHTSLPQMINSTKQHQFGEYKKTSLPRYCQKCKVRFACNGGCPKDRVAKTPSGEPGLNYLCAGYKAFFTHIDKPMREMARLLLHGKPASEIMSQR